MGKQNKRVIVFLLILAALLAVFAAAFILPGVNITRSSERFVRSLVEGNNPEQYCTGDVLYRISTTHSTKAKVVSIETLLIDHSTNFARVYVDTEMQLADQSYDVGFYELELINDHGWKVYGLKETMPRVQSLNLPRKDISAQIENLYLNSVKQLAAGNDSSLAGPARTAFKRQPEIKSQSEISDITTEILYHDKLVIAKHTYNYNFRQVQVLVNYYLTKDGYKIVAIQAI